MRTVGAVQDARGLAPHDHLCWVYDEESELVERALEFLAEGLANGQQIRYFGGPGLEEIRSALRRVSAPSDAHPGAVSVGSFDEIHGSGSALRPHELAARFIAATHEALDAGFNGLRIVADATALVREPAQRSAWLRFEHLIDRQMAAMPFVGMCAFDRRVLGPHAGQVASMHPVANVGATEFSVYAHRGLVSVQGEVDASVQTQFAGALECAIAASDAHDGTVVIDGTSLTFIDHRGLIALRDCARRFGASAVLRTASATPGRLIEMLELDGVTAEEIA